MPRTLIALTCAAALASQSAPTGAATTIDFLLKQGGPSDVAQTAFIDKGRMLIRGAGGDPAIDLLFVQAGETMTVINHADKTTLDIDAEKVMALVNQAQGMMAIVRQQVAQQMEGMSQEERDKLAQMLENMGGSSLLPPEQPAAQPAAQEKTFRRVGAQTINGFQCEQTEIYEGDNKVADICAAEPDTLGISDADFAVIDAMHEMARKLRDQTATLSEQMGQNIPQFGDSEVPGVPVQMIDKAGNSMTVSRIQTGIGDADLNTPAGYKVKQMPSLPQLTQ